MVQSAGSTTSHDLEFLASGDDDALTLPWWYSWWRVALLTAVSIVALGAGVFALANRDKPLREDGVDLGFLSDMNVHHGQAVEMAFRYRDLEGTDETLRTIALSIITSQSFEIGSMSQLRLDLGAPLVPEQDITDFSEPVAMAWMNAPVPYERMPGMATDTDLDALSAATGAEADQIFAALMSAHHKGGVDMAEFAATNARTSKVRAIGASIAQEQAREIAELERFVK